MKQIHFDYGVEKSNLENDNFKTSPNLEENQSSNDNEVEIQDYTDEQKEILEYLDGIIAEGFDPACPLGIYTTTKKYYRVDYTKNGEKKTGYLVLAEGSDPNKTLKGKRFVDITVIDINDVNLSDIPSTTKYMNVEGGDLFSFKLKLVLSSPKWFSILYKKNATKVQVVLTEKTIASDVGIQNSLSGYKYKHNDQWCNIDAGKTHQELMALLHKIRPILKERYEFIYSHRIVDPCCCELQKICINEKRCVSHNREMQMKCSFRKLKEREGDFTKPALYSVK